VNAIGLPFPKQVGNRKGPLSMNLSKMKTWIPERKISDWSFILKRSQPKITKVNFNTF
jgi:hypothetical protein